MLTHIQLEQRSRSEYVCQNHLAGIRTRVPKSESVAAPRRRGPSLARRTYQAGSVFQKGRNKAERWESKMPAYGRYWKDVPGSSPKRVLIALGVCRTRSVAERKCAQHIEQLGINSTQRFVESTSTVTFKQQ